MDDKPQQEAKRPTRRSRSSDRTDLPDLDGLVVIDVPSTSDADAGAAEEGGPAEDVEDNAERTPAANSAESPGREFNATIIGTLRLCFAARDVEMEVDGDIAMRVMATTTGQQGWQDKLAPASPIAHHGWLTYRAGDVLASMWEPREFDIDALVAVFGDVAAKPDEDQPS
jgi:hypothetical protein